jgi:hypothetical protein
MYKNNQLSKLQNSKIKNKEIKLDVIKSQFGKADYSIDLKDFIKLPTLHEVFDEIIPSTRLKEQKGNYFLSLYDEELNINYNEPLILLDNMPVFDINELLKIKPAFIKKIDIINKRYLVGKKIFNGIVILTSNTKDFCKINIPEESVFLKYQGISPKIKVIFPEYKDPDKSRIPDFRTLLYWETDCLLEEETAVLRFYASDHESDYEVLVRGVDEKGNVYTGRKRISIKR